MRWGKRLFLNEITIYFLVKVIYIIVQGAPTECHKKAKSWKMSVNLRRSKSRFLLQNTHRGTKSLCRFKDIRCLYAGLRLLCTIIYNTLQTIELLYFMDVYM